MRSAVTTHLETNNILTDAQHGFRKGRSCVSQLISIVDDLAAELNRGGQTDAILLDFSKAFDKVPHRRLLLKLAACGVEGKTLSWIKEFLSNRTQEVVVGGESSDIGHVTSGVPQGSVLGPTLFLVYINDLENNISSTVRLFADDTILYKTITTSTDAANLNEDLKKLQDWEAAWQMEFNVTKCHAITFSNKKSPIISDYTLHEHSLEHVKSAKYLGVELTNNLNWSRHIHTITAKANKTSAFIWRNLKGCPVSTHITCFKTLVRPLLEYASVVWDPHQITLTNELEKVQKRAIKRICPTQNFSLEQVETRRKRDKVSTMYKITNNTLHAPLPPTVRPRARTTRGHNKRLTIPHARINAYKHSFYPSTAQLWNALPPSAVDSTTICDFKKNLSTLNVFV